ncbi:hypothetical protein [Acidipropionibacterium jensenii]|uniref:hypothetical protein n=1 Tax=Acidipropionibacterium jensenii TaxID=1749 RepID=UPI000FD7C514|nr:hypothetical protein [Acidipropionibacterium jensenii]
MPRFLAGQFCFWGDVVGDGGAEVGVDACHGEDGFVGEVLVIVDDDLPEQCPVEEAPLCGVAFGVEVAEVGEDVGDLVQALACGGVGGGERL